MQRRRRKIKKNGRGLTIYVRRGRRKRRTNKRSQSKYGA